ncbi:hypothetical protein CVV68_01280 [Arthrobacter livingstonensis]|uniref:Uncharacterized protein n=1 Tax=Arthrobacter livingstonensis TaxID=670078 RepID=A0A2V5LDS0_9MICC|nr:hypothetical protein CVV68_01280 [Arthrobacter livingstonensis]
MVVTLRVSPRKPDSRSVLWMLVVVVLGVSALTACTGGVAPVSSPTGEHQSATPTGSGVSASSHFNDACTQARPVHGPVPGPTDIAIGKLSFGGARAAANLPSTDAPILDHGSTFYKMGAQLPANTSATVTIVAPEVSEATIIAETGPKSGTRSVTYTNCTDTAQWWVAGFVLWGRQTGCVTVETTSSADPTPQRAVISLNAGKCPPA